MVMACLACHLMSAVQGTATQERDPATKPYQTLPNPAGQRVSPSSCGGGGEDGSIGGWRWRPRSSVRGRWYGGDRGSRVQTLQTRAQARAWTSMRTWTKTSTTPSQERQETDLRRARGPRRPRHQPTTDLVLCDQSSTLPNPKSTATRVRLTPPM